MYSNPTTTQEESTKNKQIEKYLIYGGIALVIIIIIILYFNFRKPNYDVKRGPDDGYIPHPTYVPYQGGGGRVSRWGKK